MNKNLSIILTIAFFAGILPTTFIHAAVTDIYAESVYSAGNQTYQPTNAVGEADEKYTDFFDKDTTLILDLGEANQFLNDLTIYFRIQNYGAGFRVEFLDGDLAVTKTISDHFPLSVSELTLAYSENTAYRYVRLTNIEEETWSLDAIKTSVEIIAEEGEEETTETTEEPEAILETEICGGNQGLNVKRVDDNNPETTADSIIYTIGCDGLLHIFPNEQIYKTWWPDFENLSFIDGTFLAQHELADNVTIRSGTYLIKTVSSPKVYAVEPGGILRWIPDEVTALALYGINWNKIIIDIPDELFPDYTIGEDLTTAAYPNGVIGYLPDEGRVVYLSENYYYNMPGDTINSLHLNTEFLIPLSAEIMANYTDGGGMIYNQEVAFPF
jgi:hypothetical protein